MDSTTKKIIDDQFAAEQNEFFRGYRVSFLREIFNKHCDQSNWKNPFSIKCKGEELSVIINAIGYFLGDTPDIFLDTRSMIYTVSSHGYQCF